METEIKSYLCESVLVQKGLSIPRINLRASSQGGSAMGRRDEAGQLYFEGGRIGLYVARAAVPTAKRECPASVALLEGVFMRLPLSVLRVLDDVTWRKWIVSLTGEVLRCLCSFKRVTPVYKACVRNDWPMQRRGEDFPNRLLLKDGSRPGVPSSGRERENL